MIVQI